MTEGRFWRTMTYGCDSGDRSHELVFYLEEGCEGPRDRSVTAFLPENHPFNPRGEIQIDYTSSGRAVVPVPFVAGRCEACLRAGGCGRVVRGRFGSQQPCGEFPSMCGLSHTRWEEDRDLRPRVNEPPEGAGAFLYPTPEEQRRDGMQACGRPVYPLHERVGPVPARRVPPRYA